MRWFILFAIVFLVACKEEKKEPESPKFSRAEIWNKVDRLKYLDNELKKIELIKDSIRLRIVDSLVTLRQEDSSDLMFELVSDKSKFLDSLEAPLKREARNLMIDVGKYKFPESEYDSLLRITERLKNI